MKERITQPVTPSTAAEKTGSPVQLSQTLTITKRIGKGRLGVVYAAVHDVLARRFAVKVLRPVLTSSEEVRHRLRRVVREVSQVEHPNIVALVDFGQVPDGRFYLTMEYVRGVQLSRVLEREGRCPAARALPILLQLAEALDSAHRSRTVHGDLKPNNIMLMELSGGRDLVKVCDWMLSSALVSSTEPIELSAHLQAHGTVDYLAPEQLSQRSSVDGRCADGRTDQYAFGALAYHLLTGQPPFTGEPSKIAEAHCTLEPVPLCRRSGVDDVSGELDAIVLRCLEKDPASRFKAMDQVVRALQSISMATQPAIPAVVVTQPESDDEPGLADEPQAEPVEERLPESPARLRQRLYDIILELAQLIIEKGSASTELVQQMSSLKQLSEESTQLGGQIGLTENRFEDIRRELREAESALRYAMIDLNLMKSDLLEKGQPSGKVDEIDGRISELERSLAALENQRTERFVRLNDELSRDRERIKTLEQQMAFRFRHLYAQLNARRPSMRSAAAQTLFQRLERCRTALALQRQQQRSKRKVS